MTAFTPFSYLFLDLRTCIVTNYCVSCQSARPTAYGDEILLYANWTYTEYGTKTRIEPTEATGIYSFVFLICAEYELEIFGATSDERRLMEFYVNPEFIDVSLYTWVTTSDEIGIITKDLCLNCTENELQTCLNQMTEAVP